MSATRTQIYLRSDQRRRIDEAARAERLTLAEIVRRALDRYLAEEAPDPAAALEETFGVVPDLDLPSRDEWDRARRG
jgi:hypothetical protein